MKEGADLAQLQDSFMAQILDDAAPLPPDWNGRHADGMAVYRNNYRSALVEALASTFEQVQHWVGEESFRRAAAHHLITHPPSSWTLDDAGAGFDTTCRELFAANPEVPELVWIEWAMHRAYVAADIDPMSAQDFAIQSEKLAEDDWENLRLSFVPSLRFLHVTQDVAGLWRALNAGEVPPKTLPLENPVGLVVWREDLTPAFLTIDENELDCLSLIHSGGTYGQACALLAERLGDEQGIGLAGAMLGRWLMQGWLAGIAV